MPENLDDLLNENPHPLEFSIEEHFSGPHYISLIKQWDKAVERLPYDADGAITSAKAFLESTCKKTLDVMEVEYGKNSDLPKLYNMACKSLGIAPSEQHDKILKSIYSTTYQVVNSVAQLRNKLGDAHGKINESKRTSRAEAELVVHLSGAISCFIVRYLESHLSINRRLTSDGKAILQFEKSIVWRLVDHSTNSPGSMESRDKVDGPCLLLVGDAGIYLMSNGLPPLHANGKIMNDNNEKNMPRLIALADGCNHKADIDEWWPIHNAIEGGDDFALSIPVDNFRDSLDRAVNSIVMIVDRDHFLILSDIEYEKHDIPSV